MDKEDKMIIGGAILLILVILYGLIGTEGRINEIKSEAPKAIEQRNWSILRYEGYQRGSFGKHGGKVWYHVQDKNNTNTQYRVFITKWKGELHFHYGPPEQLVRIEVNK